VPNAVPLKRSTLNQSQSMKIISQKQRESALDHLADLLKRDGWMQTKTIEQWLDDAEMRPAQYQCSLPALQVLNCLGFGTELVRMQQEA
jgi:hypothetical protein